VFISNHTSLHGAAMPTVHRGNNSTIPVTEPLEQRYSKLVTDRAGAINTDNISSSSIMKGHCHYTFGFKILPLLTRSFHCRCEHGVKLLTLLPIPCATSLANHQLTHA